MHEHGWSAAISLLTAGLHARWHRSDLQRFGMYRWHLPYPVRFGTGIRVTIQALGWRSGGRYLALSDDISSTAWWYADTPGGVPGSALEADLMEVV